MPDAKIKRPAFLCMRLPGIFLISLKVYVMKELKITSEFQSFDTGDELSPQDRELLSESRKAAKKAYSPYSLFKVGAALRLTSGKIIHGNNQENVAYPSGLCAERVALFFASAEYPDEKVEAIAVTAEPENFELTEPVTPCGACRQVMAESEKKQESKIRVIMDGPDGKVWITESVKNLLPLMFKADELKK
jgi:cytidine deaminase